MPYIPRSTFLGVSLLLLACDSPLELEPCRHVSEWGGRGCAVVVVSVDEPEIDLDRPFTLTVSAALDGGGFIAHHPDPRFGDFPMILDLDPLGDTPVGDPVDIWVIARIVAPGADSGSGPATVFLAQDSAKISVTFVPVGSLPMADTVHLRPEPPELTSTDRAPENDPGHLTPPR